MPSESDDALRAGSDFTLFSKTPSGEFQSSRISLFLREGKSYGKVGSLLWCPMGKRDEIDGQKLPIHLVSEMLLGKHPLLKSLKDISSSLCFTIGNSNVQLHLQAASKDHRELWWNSVLKRLQLSGMQLQIDKSPPVSSPAAPRVERDPDALAALMRKGALFRKYDISAANEAEKIVCRDVLLLVQGVGRQGSVYWVNLSEAEKLQLQKNEMQVTRVDGELPLFKVTDMMLRKKSPVLKLATSAADECCFALVSDAYTLNLEAQTRQQMLEWKEGIINMLTNAGRKLVRAPSANEITHSPSPSPPSASAAAAPAPASQPALTIQTPANNATPTIQIIAPSPNASSTPSPSPPPSSSAPPSARPRNGSVMDRRELGFLSSGQLFIWYYQNSKGIDEAQQVFVYFTEAIGADAPGYLAWCNPGERKLIEGQRLDLNTMVKIAGGKGTPALKSSLAASIPTNRCLCIITTTPVALSLEAPSHEIREQWLEGIHSIMVAHGKKALEDLEREKAAKAAAAAATAPNSSSSAVASTPAASSSESLPTPPSAPSPERDIQILVEGSTFNRFFSGARGEESSSTFVWFQSLTGDEAPGVICWRASANKSSGEIGKISVAQIRSVIAGKETPIMRSAIASRVSSDRSISITAHNGTSLDLEATNAEMRDVWYKALQTLINRRLSASKPLIPSSDPLRPSTPLSTPISSSKSSAPNTPAAASLVSANPAKFLSDGQLFTLYSTIKGSDEVQASPMFFFFQEGTGNDAPGFVCWCPPGERRYIEGQRILLKHVTRLSAGREAPALKSAVAQKIPHDRTLTIMTAHTALGLESPSQDIRDGWMKAIHLILLKSGRKAVEEQRPAIDRGSSIDASHQRAPSTLAPSSNPTPSNSLPNTPTSSNNPSNPSSSVNPPSTAAPTNASSSSASAPSTPISSSPVLEAELRLLKEGHLFYVYTVNAQNQISASTMHVFYEASSGLGHLYWCPGSEPRRMIDSQRIALNQITKITIGKESPLFKTPSAAVQAAPPELCLTIVTPSLSLDLEARTQEMRDQWVKALHQVLVRSGKKSEKGRPSNASASPTPGSSSSSSNVSPAVATRSVDGEIHLLSQPIQMNLYLVTSRGEQMQEISLFYVESSGADAPGCIYWCAAGEKRMIDNQKLPIKMITMINLGKNTPVLKSSVAAKSPADRCFSIQSTSIQLSLEAPSMEARDGWIKALHTIRSRASPAPQRSPQPSPSPPQEDLTKAQSVVQRALQQRQQERQSQSSTPPATSSTPPPSSPTPDRSEKNNQDRSASPASAAQGGGAAQPSAAAQLSNEIRLLTNGQTFTMYCHNENREEAAVSVFLFFVESASQGEAPGFLYFCNAGERKMIASQRIVLRQINQMDSTKNSLASMFKSSIVERASADRCLTISTMTMVLHLEASSLEIRDQWRRAIHKILSVLAGKRTVDSENRPKSSSVSTPSSAQSAAAAEKKKPIGATLKSALPQMQVGQDFTRFFLTNSGLEGTEPISLFFVPLTGEESPGALHWCPPGPRQLIRENKIPINAIRQITGNKNSVVFRSSSIAAHLREELCLSISTSSFTLDLMAPSPYIREFWFRGLEHELKRNGMKAVNPEKRASVNEAKNNDNNPNNNNNPNESTVRKPRNNADLNRTISFKDPTEYFVIQAKIGEGSYGAVFKALDKRDKKTVAIKVLQFNGQDSYSLRKEIKMLKQCHSDYIVGYKGAFSKNGNVWIVMEYAHAGSLADMMQICGRTLCEAEVAVAMKMCLLGLEYLHAQNKIHRDIKGGNILATNECICKLADFGVSGNLDRTLGRKMTVIGTPHWMAPEVLVSDDYNEKADIWSLGITAYELCIGEPPHAQLHAMRAALKIPACPPPTLPSPSQWSQDFHSFLANCLIKDPENRPSATELLKHPFITKSGPATVLHGMVSKAVRALEAKEDHNIEFFVNGLTRGGGGGGGGGDGRLQTKKRYGDKQQEDEGDMDFDLEDINDFGATALMNSDTMLLKKENDEGTMVIRKQDSNNNINNSNSSSNNNNATMVARPRNDATMIANNSNGGISDNNDTDDDFDDIDDAAIPSIPLAK